jgi:hypothetical protein
MCVFLLQKFGNFRPADVFFKEKSILQGMGKLAALQTDLDNCQYKVAE